MKKFDLEDRLINFSVAVLDFSEKMPDTKASTHLCGQLIRSATAPALVYGEANAAESPSDFVHKMGVALKELRETHNCLRIIQLKKYFGEAAPIEQLINECKQLIRIFGASINTVKMRNQLKP
ncbi:MAG TPA: four helix bundle protein [Cyclobacteriaceae bacterium]|nr:four helix bundle protein [Cyclobacteriaceae bacterium]